MGTVEVVNGATQISGFDFDAEGGPIVLEEMAQLALDASVRGWHWGPSGERVYVYRVERMTGKP